MIARRFRTLALLLVVLSACAPKVERPQVELAGVRLGGLGLQGGLLYVRLSVANPNRFSLQATGLTYDIDLSDSGADGETWIDLAEGTLEQEIRVGARDSTTVEIPIEFRYSGLGGAVRSIIETGTFDYRVGGTVALTRPIDRGIPYSHRGTVALSGSR